MAVGGADEVAVRVVLVSGFLNSVAAVAGVAFAGAVPITDTSRVLARTGVIRRPSGPFGRLSKTTNKLA